MSEYFLSLLFIGVLIIYHIAMIKWYSSSVTNAQKAVTNMDAFNIIPVPVRTSVPDHYQLS